MQIFFLADGILIYFFLLNFSFDADFVVYSYLFELLFFFLFESGCSGVSFIHSCYNTRSIYGDFVV